MKGVELEKNDCLSKLKHLALKIQSKIKIHCLIIQIGVLSSTTFINVICGNMGFEPKEIERYVFFFL